MRHRTAAALIAVTCFLLPGARALAEEPAAPPKPKLEFVYLRVTGVETDALAAAVQRKVQAVEGVQSFAWTTPRGEAKVVRIVGRAATPTLLAQCQAAGVKAALVDIAEQGLAFAKQLHCNGCVIKVKRALKAIKGTKEVHVAKDKRSVTVVYDAEAATIPQFQKALARVGYPATPAP